MTELTNREVVEHFIEAMNASEYERAGQYLADDYIEDYPQSRERIRGRANRMAVIGNYPGRAERNFVAGKPGVLVGDDQWVMTPAMSLVRLSGSGERFTAAGEVDYPSGERWHVVQLLELRGGKITKITSYFAPPFEPAAYRAKFVERMPAED